MENELYRVVWPFVAIAVILADAIARFLKNDPSKGDLPITPKQQRDLYGPLIGYFDGKLEGKLWGLWGIYHTYIYNHGLKYTYDIRYTFIILYHFISFLSKKEPGPNDSALLLRQQGSI